MGEIADMMLDGTLCSVCGVYIGEGDWGIPRTCGCCPPNEWEHDKKSKETRKRIQCPHCHKWVKKKGLDMHIAAKHK